MKNVRVSFKSFSCLKSRGNFQNKDITVIVGTVIKETDKQLKIRDEKGSEWTIRKVNVISYQEI